jgi:hypothetical protein
MNLDKLLVELEGIGRIAKEWKMQRAIADIEREIVLAKLRDIYTEIKLGSAEIVGSAQTADNNTCENCISATPDSSVPVSSKKDATPSETLSGSEKHVESQSVATPVVNVAASAKAEQGQSVEGSSANLPSTIEQNNTEKATSVSGSIAEQLNAETVGEEQSMNNSLIAESEKQDETSAFAGLPEAVVDEYAEMSVEATPACNDTIEPASQDEGSAAMPEHSSGNSVGHSEVREGILRRPRLDKRLILSLYGEDPLPEPSVDPVMMPRSESVQPVVETNDVEQMVEEQNEQPFISTALETENVSVVAEETVDSALTSEGENVVSDSCHEEMSNAIHIAVSVDVNEPSDQVADETNSVDNNQKSYNEGDRFEPLSVSDIQTNLSVSEAQDRLSVESFAGQTQAEKPVEQATQTVQVSPVSQTETSGRADLSGQKINVMETSRANQLFGGININKVTSQETAGGVRLNEGDGLGHLEITHKKVLGEALAAPTKAVNEILGQKTHHTDVAFKLRSSKVSDLRHSIGINDRFLLIRDLFNGDTKLYEQTISDLEQFTHLDDAMIYIQEHFDWDPDSDGVMLLVELLECKLER